MGLSLRVASVSFSIDGIRTFDDFTERVRRHVDFAKDHGSELICFPEYVTAPLLSSRNKWSEWDQKYRDFFSDLAQKNQIDILGGTHLTRTGKSLLNDAYIFTANGQILTQPKIHATPFEKAFFGVEPGSNIQILNIKGITIGIAICYDVEFASFVSTLVDKKIDVLLVPSCTDDTHGFWRVRYCCQARCVEHQVYVVQSVLVGKSSARGFEQNVGRAGIFSPSDVGFPEGGVLAESMQNHDACIVADLDIDRIRSLASEGTVTPRLDRRSYSNLTFRADSF